MSLPEHLKIGYEVVRVSTGTKDFELQGEFDAEQGTIIVAAKGTPRRRMATLMHEVLHACWDQAEMGDLGDHDKEEQIVNRLASVLTAVLLDNPQLLRCLHAAGGSANSTCWRPKCDLPGCGTNMARCALCAPDNERRSEQRRCDCGLGDVCYIPERCALLKG